jgi:hypothetical protein
MSWQLSRFVGVCVKHRLQRRGRLERRRPRPKRLVGGSARKPYSNACAGLRRRQGCVWAASARDAGRVTPSGPNRLLRDEAPLELRQVTDPRDRHRGARRAASQDTRQLARQSDYTRAALHNIIEQVPEVAGVQLRAKRAKATVAVAGAPVPGPYATALRAVIVVVEHARRARVDRVKRQSLRHPRHLSARRSLGERRAGKTDGD